VSVHAKEALRTAGEIIACFLIIVVLIVLPALIAQGQGWFGPPADEGTKQEDSEFAYRARHGMNDASAALAFVSEEIREEIQGGFGSDPAYAHAVNACWNRPYAKISNLTGGGRHRTVHRYDRNGYRYTKTQHQVLSNGSWVTVAVYYARVPVSSC
jgi:hypothetical protein